MSNWVKARFIAGAWFLAATAGFVVLSPGEPDTETIVYCWDAECVAELTTEDTP